MKPPLLAPLVAAGWRHAILLPSPVAIPPAEAFAPPAFPEVARGGGARLATGRRPRPRRGDLGAGPGLGAGAKGRADRSPEPDPPAIHPFSVPLATARPRPSSPAEAFAELWNDPRPISSLFASGGEAGEGQTAPYCVVSEEFDAEGERFQILLYPRGRFDSSSGDDGGVVAGPASAYLRYLPARRGDEVDVAWKLRLRGPDETLSVGTSGGLPRSNTTWSAAMTFCSEAESVESVGRTADWGSSSWSAEEVCDALDDLVAEGEIAIYGRRSGENSLSLPLLQRGGLGAVYRAANAGAEPGGGQREFRAGEVIVTVTRGDVPGSDAANEALKRKFVLPGVDYRVMTLSDGDGRPIFSTQSLGGVDEKRRARLALRPCGWKLQRELWKKDGMKTDWPVEVEAGLLSDVTTTRFNLDSALPRVVSAFTRDWFTYSLALAVALAPLPLVLATRSLVSPYVIPSASMEPTLHKGDVLLAEKFPGARDRARRGDVVLFEPPPALREIVGRGGSKISGNSLFVKRIAGLPGDANVRLVGDGDVTIDGVDAVGPDRDLCEDEPLRLIDRWLEDGKGKEIDRLGDNDVYVLGDCKAVSIDSRVFGSLPRDNIVGRPVARIWPPSRIQLSGPF
ncbi:hypothetical protein ACHAWF_015730 [Thalassiosira exigua]